MTCTKSYFLLSRELPFPHSVKCGPIDAKIDGQQLLEYFTNAIQMLKPGFRVEEFLETKEGIETVLFKPIEIVSFKPIERPPIITSCGPCGSTDHEVWDCPFRHCDKCGSKGDHWSRLCPYFTIQISGAGG